MTKTLKVVSYFVLFSIFVKVCVASVSGVGADFIDNIVSKSVRPVNIQPSMKKIIIDAGHGGKDGGATGVNGVLEKDLNLQVSLLLKDIFESFGYEVIMTRTDDRMLGDGPKGQKKLADLKARLDVASKHPDALFISIHMNKFPEESCKGLQVYYSRNDTRSAQIAEILCQTNRTYLQKDNHREIKPATSAIYILDRIQIPAILIECGFLSNHGDAKNLSDKEYQKKLAFVIFASVANYLAGENSK